MEEHGVVPDVLPKAPPATLQVCLSACLYIFVNLFVCLFLPVSLCPSVCVCLYVCHSHMTKLYVKAKRHHTSHYKLHVTGLFIILTLESKKRKVRHFPITYSPWF